LGNVCLEEREGSGRIIFRWDGPTSISGSFPVASSGISDVKLLAYANTVIIIITATATENSKYSNVSRGLFEC